MTEFAVRRSPFAVRRSPFAVARLRRFAAAMAETLVVLGVAAVGPLREACMAQSSTSHRSWSSGHLPGVTPGTYRYLVQLQGRSFNPETILALARREADPGVRKQILAGLLTAAQQDQLALKQSVEAIGGRLRDSFWAVNVAHAEFAPARANEVKALARVARLWPVEAREPSSVVSHAAGAPDPESGNQWNHNFSGTMGAHYIPAADSTKTRGAGVTIGFLDSGLDTDAGGGTTNNAFGGGTTSRLLGSFLVPGSMLLACDANPWNAVDCNLAHPFVPEPPWNPNATHFDARHGTGSASVALGGFGHGHAPDALAVGWSITRGYKLLHAVPPTCPGRWLADDASFLAAIQSVRTWNATETNPYNRVRVLNVSWDGWSDPQHPVEVALDLLGYGDDILVTSSAGNDWDSTRLSHAQCNGLSVGAVEKRFTYPSFWPNWSIASYSSRGPLFGDPARAYPDVCAVGNVDKQHVDHAVPGVPQTYASMGTSNASPQVAGAAALYRARRDAAAYAPAATALETKAAILTSLAEPYRNNIGSGSPYGEQPRTHANWNAYGQGFVRDDYLADYAERFGTDQGIGQRLGSVLLRASETVTISPSTSPWPEVQWTGLATDQDYVVAIAWHRPVGETPGVTYPLPNVDLEVVQGPSAQVVARSASLANSYERVVFRPGYTTVKIRVIGRQLDGDTLVHIAARKHPEPLTPPDNGRHLVRGMVESVPQPCAPVANPSQNVTVTLPLSYTDTWGSVGPDSGFKIPRKGFHVVFEPQELPASPVTIRGIWFRSWREHGNTYLRQARVDVLGLAQTNRALASANDCPGRSSFDASFGSPAIYDNSNAPNRATFLANQLLDFPEVKCMAQDKNAWVYYLPLPPSFTFSPTADPTRTKLAVWLQWKDVSPGVQSDPPAVDWAFDLGWPLYATSYYQDGVGGVPKLEQGYTPILGLVTGPNAAAALDCVGEPVSWNPYIGNPFSVVFRATNMGQPDPARTRFLLVGLANPNAILSGPHGCLRLMSDATYLAQPLPTWSLDGGAATHPFALPVNDSLIHMDMWAQVLELVNANGEATQATNGVRLRVGGRRQQ